MVKRWSQRWWKTLILANGLAVGVGLAAAPVGSRRQSAFSEDEFRALYSRLESAGRLAQVPLPEIQGDPIELEAYVVEGDGTLLLAALRRQLELGPVSIRERVAELSPALNRQAQFSGRQSDTFLAAPTLGKPADSSAPVPFDLHDFITIERAVSRAVRGVLPKQ